MESYIIHGGNKYVAAAEHEAMLEEYAQLKKKCECVMSENDKLRTKSEIDTLTGVYRRTAAIEQITQLLKGGVKTCVLIVLDLDNFKHINDTFGHKYGDAVIITVATAITKEVNGRGIVGRFGGDEFLVFMPDADTDEAFKTANNIIKTIGKFNAEPNEPNRLSCSAGIAVRKGNITYNSLFTMADKALYSAKNNGKSRAEVYNHINMKNINRPCITYTDEDDIEKNPYGDIISRAIEMASRSGTTEDAIYALFSHIAMNFGIISATILAVNISEDMITVNYGYKLSSEDPSKVRRKNTVGYYLHQDLAALKNELRDRTVLHIPQAELRKMSPKLAREVCDGDDYHRLFYAHMHENGNYSIASFIVPGPLKYWGEDELKAIAEISSILMVYADKARYISKHEENLQERINTDKLTGTYSMSKFYEVSGLIRKLAVENNANCYFINIKLTNIRDFNMKYSMTVGDGVLKDFAVSLLKSPYRSNGAVTHNSGKFYIILRTEDSMETVKKSYAESAKEFIEKYKKNFAELPLEIAIGIIEVHSDEVLAEKIDESYYTRTKVE